MAMLQMMDLVFSVAMSADGATVAGGARFATDDEFLSIKVSSQLLRLLLPQLLHQVLHQYAILFSATLPLC
jgi:hypothetical protein